MTFRVSLYQDEDGIWIVECPALPGCVSQGDTRQEALVNIKDAIEGCLTVLNEQATEMVDENGQASPAGSNVEYAEVSC